MRSRTPIVAAVALALLVLCFALWSFRDGGAHRSDSSGGVPRGSAPDGNVALLKDRPLPQRQAPGAEEAGQAQVPPLAPPPAETPKAGGDETLQGGDGSRMTRAERLAALRKAEQGAAAARATEEEVAIANDPLEGGHALPENQAAPTFPPSSIYDGLSQDDLLELMVAARRIRDAGVFVKLTPEQFFDVERLLGNQQGVQDADEITQRILGMGVGEWLDHERGPKGRFVLH